MSAYDELYAVMAGWPRKPIPMGRFGNGCLDRLARSLRLLRDRPSEVGAGDIAGAVRDVLRYQKLTQGIFPPVCVPKRSSWPDDTMWHDYGVEVELEQPGSFLIRVGEAWHPHWLEGAAEEPPLLAAAREEQRRNDPTRDSMLLMDPCIAEKLGPQFSCYQSHGQRQAIHGVFTSPPGAVLLVLLPTGAGKSLAAWAPALLTEHGGGTTVVVTPTVALAIDQERQLHELTASSEPFAYYGDREPAERELIRHRIRDGTQRIVFASPESAIGSLSPSLYSAASQGLLRAFVVDEAHLIGQWGNEFRPEFQSIAGARRDLLAKCPPDREFRTILLTATLTEDTFDTLAAIFTSPNGRLEVVAAVHLRPEPSYWARHAPSRERQVEWVLEAVRHAPRPFLLYATRPQHAQEWVKILNERAGIQLTRCVHGGTSGEVRREVIDAWRRGELDGIVATSAFGLGMDKRDVRAVIHACATETVDRLYQEVGRGGRDGKACVSIVVYTDDDLRTARTLNQQRIISVDRGYERWEAMLATRREQGGPGSGLYQVSLRAKPPGIVQDSAENEAWNVRTLILMARAGLIRLDAAPPPRSGTVDGVDLLDADEVGSGYLEESDERMRQALQEHFASAFVRILSAQHSDMTWWNQQLEPERKRTREADEKNFKSMVDVLSGQREMADVLCDLYTIHRPWARVDVTPCCGGCVVCRRDGIDRRNYHAPEADPIRDPYASVDPGLLKAIGSTSDGCRAVVYRTPSTAGRDMNLWRARMLEQVLPRLVTLGLRELVAASAWHREEGFNQLYRYARDGFLIHRRLEDSAPELLPELGVPRLTLLSPEFRQLPEGVLSIRRPFHLLLLPDDLPDPLHPLRRFTDTANFVRLDELLARIDQLVAP